MRKLKSFLLLSITTLSMFAFTKFILPVQAGPGTHHVRVIYYKAYIYDDHDGWPKGAGEWYFRLWADGAWTSYTPEYKRDGPGYVEFWVRKTWYVSGMNPVEFACQAREKDSGWDYTSEIPVIFGMWYTTPNMWHYEDVKKGDVKHYYQYMVDNILPTVGSISGPDSGEPGVPYTYTTTGSDPEWDPITYEWSVDGVIQPATGPSLTYTFPSAGTYTISVRTKDYFGAYSRHAYRTVTIREPITFELQLSAGWNAVSFPCIPNNPGFDDVLGDCGFYQALYWDCEEGRYRITTKDVKAGRGYWVLVLEDCTVTVTGLPVDSYELDLCIGWEMIGTIACTVDADCVFPSFYQLLTWDGISYVSATTIELGKAYWALVLEPTHIVVDDSCCI